MESERTHGLPGAAVASRLIVRVEARHSTRRCKNRIGETRIEKVVEKAAGEADRLLCTTFFFVKLRNFQGRLRNAENFGQIEKIAAAEWRRNDCAMVIPPAELNGS